MAAPPVRTPAPGEEERAAGSRPADATPTGRGGPAGRGRFTPYLFLAPYLILFVTFVAVPAVAGVWISLHNWDFLVPNKPFVGVENYAALFDPSSVTGSAFWLSMRATALFTVLSVPLLLVVPLLLALLLNRRFPGRTFFRAVYFAPYVLGVAVIGLLWQFILDPNVGLVNFMLSQVGMSERIPWLTQEPWVWVSLVGVTVWWTLGFNSVIYLAGLQDIAADQYEAASVDGANAWQKFWNVTLPGLRPVLLFVTTTTVLASANMFGQAYLITGGAPGNRSRTAVMYIAQEGLGNFRMGNAAAMSYVLMLFLAAISLGIFAAFRRWEA